MEYDEQPTSLVETIVDDVQLQHAIKINLSLLITLSKILSLFWYFLYQGAGCKRESPSVKVSSIQQFDEIIAKRKEKRQCFDVCI